MTTPHEQGDTHYPEPANVMEEQLIEEITQIQAQLGLDLLGPKSAIALRAASTETPGRQADRYENLAMLYRRLAVRRRPAPPTDDPDWETSPTTAEPTHDRLRLRTEEQ